jgi:hypothetical protein
MEPIFTYMEEKGKAGLLAFSTMGSLSSFLASGHGGQR